MSHQFCTIDSEENTVDCIVCGSEYDNGGEDAGHCTGRTDLVHGYDTSAHSLDGCPQFDENGECEHTRHECDCIRCR